MAFVTTRSFLLRNNHVNRAVEILLKSIAGIYSTYKYLFLSQNLNLNLNSPRLHVWGVIKTFVDCLYKIWNPWGTSVKFWTFLTHHMLRLYTKLRHRLIIFSYIIKVFVRNREICFKPISIAVNHCVTLLCYVVTWRSANVGNWTL